LAGTPASLKTDTQLFYVDRTKITAPIPAAERKAKARAKILTVEKKLNPYPHMKSTVNRPQKKKKEKSH